jgi:hypothetical protein
MNNDTEGASFKIFAVCMGLCLIAFGALGLLEWWQ